MKSCKIASELSSIETHRRLTFWEKGSLAIHRMICAPCRAYKKQIHFMNKQLAKITEHDNPQKFTLDDEARKRISEKIKNPPDSD